MFKRIKTIGYFIGSVLPIILFSCTNKKASSGNQSSAAATSNNLPINLYDIKIPALVGDSIIDMAQFKGKKILFVNVASKCGYTSQYSDLEKLNQTYKNKLVIIGCPCNQFMGQEPGNATEIAQFCSSTYQVTFRMTEKLNVLGKNQHPLYQFLTQKSNNKIDDFTVTWNFNKFLIDENGKLLKYFGSGVSPMSNDITSFL